MFIADHAVKRLVSANMKIGQEVLLDWSYRTRTPNNR